MTRRPSSPPEPELVALVRAIARADAEEDVAPLKRRTAETKALLERFEPQPCKVYLSILPVTEGVSVYFMRAGDGPIKIGMSSNPEGRRRGLQTASGEMLVLHAAIPGSRERETYLHDVFNQERMQGEWFRPSERLLGFIADLVK